MPVFTVVYFGRLNSRRKIWFLGRGFESQKFGCGALPVIIGSTHFPAMVDGVLAAPMAVQRRKATFGINIR